MENKSKNHWSERPITRWIANILAVLAIFGLAFVIWQRVLAGPDQSQPGGSESEVATQAPISNTAPAEDINLAPIVSPSDEPDTSISRSIEFKTIIPDRPNVNVITYTVQKGDTLFGIADFYKIKPESVLWGNFEVLKDNPNMLSTDQVLNILPTNGVYYKWQEGDTVESVAAQFKTDPNLITEFPGNHFDLTQISEGKVVVAPGTWLIVPDGKRPIKDWGPPAISRSNPASARYYGEGSCGSVYEGAIGSGSFIWPTAYHGITQSYNPIHPAIDIGGQMGDSIVASDSGVVVFAGWSNYGYGNMIVIDHGSGFQTAYAHLSVYAVGCGQSVFQGGYIGAMGSTGNSTGPHLHFEIVMNGAKPNPLGYLP